MTTIKERFLTLWTALSGQTRLSLVQHTKVSQFFKQELELLAETVEAGVSKNVHSEYRQALVDVVELIRDKSKELE